ncbi:DinB family protein [Paenibacillus glycanilyticus]|uniref:DinB-like domain-containing protein n=1 Tax=Paenibacillus glycanilyticus TaxID=126569 RepID=A0ABQ6GMH4_9BACL|nr:DinB family protein [Paenibacillus glycanilyticus]GLX70541.1 hypothetical protein MU1_48870 [Paenibacillus glycanilyticus]
MLVNLMTARLEKYIAAVPTALRAWPEEKLHTPLAVGKWSKVQILGHLCDSAINNVRRMIEAQASNEVYLIAPYNQNQWVEAQSYGNAHVDDVITLWESLNRAMARVIAAIPDDRSLSRQVKLPSGELHTLEWLIMDYMVHLEHHLQQISPELVEKR